MKLKRFVVAALTSLMLFNNAFPSYASTPTYSSWDGVRAALGPEHAIGHRLIPPYQFWGPGKTGPTANTSDFYFSASNLEVCKWYSSDRFKIKGNSSTYYYRYNDPYKAVCTYTSGYESMNTNYDYYIPCMKHKYWVDPSRSGDFFATNINGHRYNYKRDPAVQISDGSYIDYTDSNHNGADIYKYGRITFRIAHNASAKRNRRSRKVIWSFCAELGKRTFLCSYNTEFPPDLMVYCTMGCIYLFLKYLQRTDNVLHHA